MRRPVSAALFLLATLVAGAGAASAQTSAQCYWDDLECRTVEGGLAAASPGQIDTVADAITGTRARFETHFGRPAPQVAVVEGTGRLDALRAQLETDGYPAALPWITRAQKEDLKTAAIRKQVVDQLPPGTPDAVINAAVQQALSKISKVSGESEDEIAAAKASEASALNHEIGHVLFMEAYWPDRESSGGKHYGGPAPDWFDETAALLMEDDSMQQGRWDRLLDTYAEPDGFIPLDQLFSMQHPLLAAVQAYRGKDGATGSQTGAIVITGEEADRLLKAADIPDPELYYRQGLGLARYMMETSGNPAIFGAIAKGLASGETMESWLAADGAAAGLPGTVEALEAAFLDWLSTNAADRP